MSFNNLKNILKSNQCFFYHFNVTNSTMDDAKKFLKKVNSNLVVIADEQKKGKGRRGNSWLSPPGNIYCSIVIKNIIPLKEYFLFSMITLISIKETLKKLGCNEIYFKWPNDIFFQNMKFGGIILETHNTNNNEKFVIIGMGINFLSSPKVDVYKTTFIKDFINLENHYSFLENFFINFFYYWNNFFNEKNYIISEFKNSLMFLKQKIQIKINNDKNISGIFKGINNDGALILDKGKEIIYLYSGSIII